MAIHVSREQVLSLLADLHGTRGMALLLISHDLAAVEQIAERIVVLYAGRVVESGPVRELIDRPLHPYTAALIAAVPGAVLSGAGRSPGERGEGTVSGADHASRGCVYRPVCPIARPRCGSEEPDLAPGES